MKRRTINVNERLYKILEKIKNHYHLKSWTDLLVFLAANEYNVLGEGKNE